MEFFSTLVWGKKRDDIITEKRDDITTEMRAVFHDMYIQNYIKMS